VRSGLDHPAALEHQHGVAILWNTDEHGRADLSEPAYRAYLESGAEAVICISNKKATLKLVADLGKRGIPAFGPIWDS
jgi:hypothetical protein